MQIYCYQKYGYQNRQSANIYDYKTRKGNFIMILMIKERLKFILLGIFDAN